MFYERQHHPSTHSSQPSLPHSWAPNTPLIGAPPTTTVARPPRCPSCLIEAKMGPPCPPPQCFCALPSELPHPHDCTLMTPPPPRAPAMPPTSGPFIFGRPICGIWPRLDHTQRGMCWVHRTHVPAGSWPIDQFHRFVNWRITPKPIIPCNFAKKHLCFFEINPESWIL
jgi:hypothetical protein